MTSLSFSKGDVILEGRRLCCAIAELKNAVIALFWEGDEPKMGTLSVALPGRVSSVLLGEKYSTLSSMVGDQLSAKYGKMVLVSTYLSALTESSAARSILELSRRVSSTFEGGDGFARS
ncbi:MAG: hypothetical protein ACUVV4_03245 [Candidatus Bathyarchaeia archaeon]